MTLKKHLVIVSIICLGSIGTGLAQDVSVNRSNKTVEVTVTQSVEVDPELAVLSIGYHNYGRTEDATFTENARVANRITQAMLDAEIPKEDIQTENVRLSRTEPQEKWTTSQREERQFEARQSWDVRVAVAQAQNVLGLAVRSGANELEDVDWQVKDPSALEAKAGAAALEKAHALADQMVKGLGGKLGDLLYASNMFRKPKTWGLMTQMATMTARIAPQKPEVRLFPKKVEQEATVHAIFAIE